METSSSSTRSGESETGADQVVPCGSVGMRIDRGLQPHGKTVEARLQVRQSRRARVGYRSGPCGLFVGSSSGEPGAGGCLSRTRRPDRFPFTPHLARLV